MATFIRKLFGHFGAKKDHPHRKPVVRSEEEAGGFGVKVAVAADLTMHAPVMSWSVYGNGGVQVNFIFSFPFSMMLFSAFPIEGYFDLFFGVIRSILKYSAKA